MVLEQEQVMTTLPVYSQLFACLYDQAEPVGSLGRGTHYSVFRSIQWREIDGDFRDSGRLHDIAVIWDEDHDTRIIELVEQLHMHGLLWPVVFIGERKGTLTLLLWQGVDPTKERSDWYEVVPEIVENVIYDDQWAVEYGRFDRDPGNSRGESDPVGIVAEPSAEVVAYLQAIDVVWQLGEKKRTVIKPILLVDDEIANLSR